MSSIALHADPFLPQLAPGTRTASALRSLMRMWEQETPAEEEESETELMVMLSGMVGGYATSLGDE
ncbi:MAG TPA: hypothetical protein VFU53_08655 [Burkholderiales bacterium]|nr:hypothetical protein [Burkholderiales bacterium]